MAEYIEREAAKRAIMSQYLNRANKTKYADVIDAVPAADVVPVVRCGECKYRKEAWVNKKGFLICPASGMEINDNDYCSYGVSKDGKKE